MFTMQIRLGTYHSLITAKASAARHISHYKCVTQRVTAATLRHRCEHIRFALSSVIIYLFCKISRTLAYTSVNDSTNYVISHYHIQWEEVSSHMGCTKC